MHNTFLFFLCSVLLKCESTGKEKALVRAFSVILKLQTSLWKRIVSNSRDDWISLSLCIICISGILTTINNSLSVYLDIPFVRNICIRFEENHKNLITHVLLYKMGCGGRMVRSSRIVDNIMICKNNDI